jgi:hypothetical protein
MVPMTTECERMGKDDREGRRHIGRDSCGVRAVHLGTELRPSFSRVRAAKPQKTDSRESVFCAFRSE